MDKEQIIKCVENFCIESNTDIPKITYTDRRTRRIGTAYPHEWRLNFNLVWFRSQSFEDCFDVIKHEVLHLKSWWITGKTGHIGYYKVLCKKYNTCSNCVHKPVKTPKKGPKEITVCALCACIIYEGDKLIRHNGAPFCSESCMNEAIENTKEENFTN